MSNERWFAVLRRGGAVTLGSTGGPTIANGQDRSIQDRSMSRPWRRVAAAACLLLALSVLRLDAFAQPASHQAQTVSPDSLTEAVRALTEQVRVLQTSVAELCADSQQARAETRELRRELDELRETGTGQKAVVMQAVARSSAGAASTGINQLPRESSNTPHDEAYLAAMISPNGFASKAGSEIGLAGNGGTEGGPAANGQNEQEEQRRSSRAASLEEEYELLSGKVDDQYQTKVESASKYRMRISGIVLMNLFSNQGTVDNIDLPMLAYPREPGDSGGSFGATLRQSEIGFEVFGPHVAGAKTTANLQVDLAGGFPPNINGINSGLMRLRTATMRMDWDNTSVVVGQDTLFFSPNSPTSFATLAQPALSYSGNLWSWVPQIRVEHRVPLGENSNLLLQGGILDPVAGEVPNSGIYRSSGPGEASRQPAYATRLAWTTNVFGQPLRLGVGGYYGRQDYGFNRNVDAWAATSDVELPLGSKLALSGKFFRGRALGGLYGGFGQSVLYSGMYTGQSYTQLIGLNTVGGWTQLKYRAATKLEFNVAFGMENPYAKDLEFFPYPYSLYGDPNLWRNRSGFANVIYRPRSDLLFSAEYRRIETNSLASGLSEAGHLNLMMGVLF